MDEALAQFCAITGADEASATHFLEASGVDVEVAVGLYMDSNGKPPVVSDSSQEPTQHQDQDEIRKPIAPTRGVLVDADDSYGNGNTHWVDPRHTLGRRPITAPFASFTDTVDLTTERGRRLAQLFRIPQEIIFVGSFDSGKKEAKSQQRYLLMSLYDTTEFVCQMLNRDVWNQENVQEFIINNLLFMQLNTATEEGERYMRLYAVTSHPHIALLDPRTGRLVKSWSQVPSPVDLIGDIIEYIERYPLKATSSTLQSPRAEVEPVCVDLTSGGQSMAEETVGPVIATLPAEPGADCADATTVQFQMPDGQRVRRRFSASSPLSTLMAFVSASLQLPIEAFEILDHSRSISELASDSSLSAAGIRNSALKVVLKNAVA